MPSDIEIYLDCLDKQCGVEADFVLISQKGSRPPIHVATYANTPDPGYATAFTVGVSELDFPDWTLMRPELFICVKSTDPRWGLAVGDSACKLLGRSSFCIGDTINFNAQISQESEMSAFLLHFPLLMDKEQATIKLPGRTVFLTQAFPLYHGELLKIREHGVEWFRTRADGADLCDVNRPDISRLELGS